jgi:proteasome lid subunit RPN8/RPN11
MKLAPEIIAAVAAHAKEDFPRECCGFIVAVSKKKREVIRAKNTADDPKQFWRIAGDEQDAAEARGEIVCVYHSHPLGRSAPSEADRVSCEAAGLPFLIYAHPLGEWELLKPCGYKPPLNGREFVHGVTDCYSFVRDWFLEERGVELPDFDREDQWWTKPNGPDLYMDNVRDSSNGFTLVSQDWRDARPGDLLLMRLMSSKVNHAAILLDGMKIIHHVPGRLSGRDTFSQFWQQCVAHVARHKSQP